jgi:hypothetical protein
MGTGLFDSPSPPLRREPTDVDLDGDGYRPISGTAIAAAALAVVSPLIFFGWSFAAVPAVATVLAAVAIRDTSRRPEAVSGGGIAWAAFVVAGLLLVSGVATLAITYANELPPGHTRLNYAALQPLPGDPPTAVPDSARALEGQDVLLKGYMYPGSRQRGITDFLLVRDQGDCCFGGNPKITDRVLVRLAGTQGIDFTQRLVKIAGRFRIELAGAPDAGGGVLYHLDDAVVR